MDTPETVKQQKTETCIQSEIGRLEGVILHAPGIEVESMTPDTVQKALYSDILNLQVASREYTEFRCVLEKYTKTYQVRDLLKDILIDEKTKTGLVNAICDHERVDRLKDSLMNLSASDLAKALIEGVELTRDNLSKFLSKERFELEPLHNAFFTRDASIAIGNEILISKMASRVRDRESLIMEAIFDFHPAFITRTVNPVSSRHFCKDFSFEGGDFIVAGEDLLMIGTGSRTTPKGIDFIIDHFKKSDKRKHIVVQELPYEPESFIHLDMVFTFIDRNECMIYEPLVRHPGRFLTIHITIDNGKVTIREEENIPAALKKVGMEITTINCGGKKDIFKQEREQWHSGANFFALEPGKIIGYGRNGHTLEELNHNGYDIIRAKDIIKGKDFIENHKKCVITIEGAELARGGGGCRCMTMPFRRAKID
ncbi:MAG TPA: arginine deiminase family protein [Lentimicrobium sp.]|nr:arginine deiminase family protein [Lentimicrobium sp.]